MKTALLSASALALIGFVSPAAAQMMCAPGQQAQASPSGAMMCGAAMPTAEGKEGEAQKPQAGGMCPCCRNMAMMRQDGSGGGMKHDMPMEMPK